MDTNFKTENLRGLVGSDSLGVLRSAQDDNLNYLFGGWLLTTADLRLPTEVLLPFGL